MDPTLLTNAELLAEYNRRFPARLKAYQPLEVFMDHYRRFLGATIEVVVRRNERFLVIERDPTDVGYAGTVHYPGGYILIGETFQDAIERITRNELGATVESWQFAGLINNPYEEREDPYGRGIFKGHHLHIIMNVTLASEPTKGSFVDRDNLPPNFIPHQVSGLDLVAQLQDGIILPGIAEEYIPRE